MNTSFENYIRARIRASGEELIRRSESLSLQGLDACMGVQINLSIPTRTEEICLPELKISFECYNDQFVKTMLNEIDCSEEFAKLED